MRWYAKSLQNKADQGLVIDEDTGRTVAVAYDQKDMAMLAAGPELAEALALAVATIKRLEVKRHGFSSVSGTLDVARAALAKAGVQ